MWRRIIPVAALLLAGLRTAAQADARAWFEANIGNPLVGEPIQLMLIADVPGGTKVTLPQFPADWPPFMVRNVGEIRVESTGGRDIYRLPLTVILWQPGDYQTPDAFVDVQPPDSAEWFRIAIYKTFFSVPTSLQNNDLQLKPLRTPEENAYLPPWIIIISITGAIAAAAGASLYITKKNPKTKTQSAKKPLTTSTILTYLKQTAELKHHNEQHAEQVNTYLREFINAQFSIQTKAKTGSEIIQALTNTLSNEQTRNLQNIIEQLNITRFTGNSAPTEAIRQLIDTTAAWIESIETKKKTEA